MSQSNAKCPAEPIRLEIQDSTRTVSIAWDDGHQSTYPWWYLRGYCPCAVCQGHGIAWDFVANENPRLTEIQEVGQYALNLVWDDTHRTGIYTFDALRTLCPCIACRKQYGAHHPWARLPPEARGEAAAGSNAHSPGT